jgi:hypothetical protein
LSFFGSSPLSFYLFYLKDNGEGDQQNQ